MFVKWLCILLHSGHRNTGHQWKARLW